MTLFSDFVLSTPKLFQLSNLNPINNFDQTLSHKNFQENLTKQKNEAKQIFKFVLNSKIKAMKIVRKHLKKTAGTLRNRLEAKINLPANH